MSEAGTLGFIRAFDMADKVVREVERENTKLKEELATLRAEAVRLREVVVVLDGVARRYYHDHFQHERTYETCEAWPCFIARSVILIEQRRA